MATSASNGLAPSKPAVGPRGPQSSWSTTTRTSARRWRTCSRRVAVRSSSRATGRRPWSSSRRGFARGVILLDLNMPWMDGWAFLRHLRGAAHSSVPVLVTSAAASEPPPTEATRASRSPSSQRAFAQSSDASPRQRGRTAAWRSRAAAARDRPSPASSRSARERLPRPAGRSRRASGPGASPVPGSRGASPPGSTATASACPSSGRCALVRPACV